MAFFYWFGRFYFCGQELNLAWRLSVFWFNWWSVVWCRKYMNPHHTLIPMHSHFYFKWKHNILTPHHKGVNRQSILSPINLFRPPANRSHRIFRSRCFFSLRSKARALIRDDEQPRRRVCEHDSFFVVRSRSVINTLRPVFITETRFFKIWYICSERMINIQQSQACVFCRIGLDCWSSRGCFSYEQLKRRLTDPRKANATSVSSDALVGKSVILFLYACV